MTAPPLNAPQHPKSAFAAALLLLLACVASVTLGPQLAVWHSGPALLLLALACALTTPLSTRLPWSIWITGLAMVAWISIRCAGSPVKEFAVADGVLLASCVASFWVTRGVLRQRVGIGILFGGLGILVLVNWIPLGLQAKDSNYVMLLPRGTDTFPSGFFSYYGDCAAFLLGMALLAGGLVWDSRLASWFRIFMGLVALAAAAGVIFTRARGGIIGLGAGGAVLLALAPWMTLRKGSRWRGLTLLVLPAIVIAGVVFLGGGLEEAQKARGPGGGPLLDNAARLFWLNLAASCISLHPLQGGGSRSFSWENLQFWDRGWQGFSAAEPEFVHSEFVQMANDYGVLGLVLLLVLLSALVIRGFVARWTGPEAKAGTAVFVAGLASLTGLLVHGCLHFVFHLPPAAMLLGVTLAAILATDSDGNADRSRRSSLAGALIPAACLAVLGYFGVKSMTVFREMAPVVYRPGFPRPGLSELMTRVDAAARNWPGPKLHTTLGKLCQQAANTVTGAESRLLLENAERAFRQAIDEHPYDPEPAVNLANVLSTMERDADAEQEFERVIRLQGGQEMAFRGRFSASQHFYRKAERLRQAGRVDEALAALLTARDHFDDASSPTAWEFGPAGRDFRLSLSQQLGPWLEGLGRHAEAAHEYDQTVEIPGADSLHFFAARNLTAWGDAVWLEQSPRGAKRNPEGALAKFRQARARILKSRGMAPRGFSATDIVELGQRLDRKIALLEEAGIRADEELPAGP